MNIGLAALSAKPYHAGHDGLVRWAARENDEVRLFVSTSDRKRPGEVPILGSDMERIWREQIEHTLPENVHVFYGGTPVARVYETISDANESGSADTFVIYSDPVDLAQSYPEKSMIKYAGNLWQNGQIILKPIERTQTVNVSGTKMRQYIASGDKESFVANLPHSIDRDAVWDTLRATAQRVPGKKAKKQKAPPVSEALLRTYISQIIKR